MAFISEETINKIRTSNDIVDIIGNYVSLTPKGKNFFGVCPFHDDHSPSMSVNREKQIYKCFSCGATGNVITFVRDYEKISFIEALEILAKNCGMNIEKPKSKEIDQKIKPLYDIYNIVTTYYKNNLNSEKGASAKEYLYNRKLDDKTIENFEIGLSLDKGLSESLLKKYDKNTLYNLDICKEVNNEVYDTFKNRIMFPIKNNDGYVVGFSGRVYKDQDKDESKYINTKETNIFKKGNILFNYYEAKESIRKNKSIIICEGQMDVIRLYSVGITNAVALMGTSFTKEQMNLIKNLKVNIILNLDQDNAGKTATFAIGNELEKENINSSVVIFSKYKDTDEFISSEGAEKFEESLKNRVSFIDFKIDYIKQNYNLNNSIELSKYINEVIKNIDNIEDPILKDLKINEIVKTYGISEDSIKSKLTTKIPIRKQEKTIIKEKKKLDKYDISELRILYLMLNDNDVIKIYEKSLGYLIKEDRTKLANEILFYKNKNKTFNYADFLTFIVDNEVINNTIKEVMIYPQDEKYTEDELESYITLIKEHSVKDEINKINEKLKNTLDIEQKKKMLKKIEKIKKEVLNW